ncbi:BEL1-like homeodomain protein 4 [Macadamia integrifolia]|uniref:BEL1-like homeodomain protein 4 n=1 Tax=Macadamia integrifolia TaxID=60698 RepID=UPI001C4E88C8|nr:BEL1-like homeodomain protein 4 [Macadamia integrifolia]XP_042495563.1 BEL1-like homeodomain protein 4 [Macadamia integrifolia]
MEVVTPPPPPSFPTHSSKNNNRELASASANCVNSMSQGFHQGIFSFSNGFDRSTSAHHQPQHIAQQSRRDKLRVQGFEPPPPPPLVGIEEEEPGELHGYETGGMLSEMFNFPPGAAAAAVAADLLDNQIASSYHLTRTSPAATATANEWYGHRQTNSNDRDSSSLASHHHPHHHHHQQQHHQISGINADSAAAMQLFLMNPQPRSPSPPPQPTSSTPLHLLLPNPSTTPPHVQGFQSPGAAAFGNSSIPTSQFTWISGSSNGGGDNPNKLGGGLVDNQGLSLSLSSSLQHLEAAKAEELRMGDGGMLYFNTGNAGSTAPSYGSMKNLRTHHHHHHHHQEPLHLQAQNHNGQVHVGFGSSSLGVVNVLRNSKYAKPAHELLEEFCSVGRGQFKNKRLSTTSNANPNQGSTSGAGTATGSPSSSKDIHPLSAADRIEYQRRKVKLVSMIDEVDRRYNHYCEQMQMVVNSFDSVMGFGAATPYTVLAQKAMSRHFRCLKDAIAAQLKHTCELLGEKDGMGASGVTKGETPRLKKLEQSLRQQRAFHQMGMMEQEAWRPQRGLPERSVNILRAWLFEHFLHPYPSDADKHLLARQTGLSRNQVSNWFINARVRLWKPMVEDMYQQEAKEEAEDDREIKRERSQQGQSSSSAQRPQTPTPITAIVTAAVAASAVVPLPTPTAAAAGGVATTTSSSTTTSTNAAVKRSEINALRVDNDHSLDAINRQCFSENQVNQSSSTTTTITTNYHDDLSTMALPQPQPQRFSATHVLDDTCRQHGGILAAAATNYGTTTAGASLIRFGTTAATATTTTGDVSLTLGLRHAGNLPEQNRYSVRDFGGC